MKGKVTEPSDSEGKRKYEKDDITTMSVVVVFIKDHLIPYVATLESSKQMYDALVRLYTINNIGQAMSLKNELSDVKMTGNDTIASYFMMISELRDQLQAIDEVISKSELVTTTLNGLPDS